MQITLSIKNKLLIFAVLLAHFANTQLYAARETNDEWILRVAIHKSFCGMTINSMRIKSAWENIKLQNHNLYIKYILEAAKAGNNHVLGLIPDDDDLGLANGDGFTPLMAAADYGQLNIVQMLMAAAAVDHGRLNTVKFLLELPSVQATINARDKDGATALHYAMFSGKLAVIKYLCQYGADQTILEVANGNHFASIAQAKGYHWVAGYFEYEKQQKRKAQQEQKKLKHATLQVVDSPASQFYQELSRGEYKNIKRTVEREPHLLHEPLDAQQNNALTIAIKRAAQDDTYTPIVTLLLEKNADILARDYASFYAAQNSPRLLELLLTGANQTQLAEVEQSLPRAKSGTKNIMSIIKKRRDVLAAEADRIRKQEEAEARARKREEQEQNAKREKEARQRRRAETRAHEQEQKYDTSISDEQTEPAPESELIPVTVLDLSSIEIKLPASVLRANDEDMLAANKSKTRRGANKKKKPILETEVSDAQVASSSVVLELEEVEDLSTVALTPRPLSPLLTQVITPELTIASFSSSSSSSSSSSLPSLASSTASTTMQEALNIDELALLRDQNARLHREMHKNTQDTKKLSKVHDREIQDTQADLRCMKIQTSIQIQNLEEQVQHLQQQLSARPLVLLPVPIPVVGAYPPAFVQTQ